mgnify:CR=1 FL=1
MVEIKGERLLAPFRRFAGTASAGGLVLLATTRDVERIGGERHRPIRARSQPADNSLPEPCHLALAGDVRPGDPGEPGDLAFVPLVACDDDVVLALAFGGDGGVRDEPGDRV